MLCHLMVGASIPQVHESQVREKKTVAGTSVLAAVFLTSIKLVIGSITGSLGILAEAAHSALDLVAAVITYFAVRVSDRPADDTHLYGHGKVENLSALVETVLLLATCAWILKEATNRLFFVSVEVDPSLWAFLTMAISIVVDFSRSRALARIAKKYNSQALEADALHFSTDIWSSSVVILGLALVRYGEFAGLKSFALRADALAALVVAIIVIHVSVRLGRRTIDALLDRAPHGLADRLSAAVSGISEVRGVSRLRVRKAGNQVFVDLNLQVPRHLSFEESHAVTRKAQEALRTISPDADVVVHAVPVAENEGVLERIQAVAARQHYAVHNITTHWTNRGVWLDLDLEVDPALTFDQAHEMATTLERQLRDELAEMEPANAVADVNVHIEPRDEELAVGWDVEPDEAASYVERITTISSEMGHIDGCQDIQVHKLKGRVYLSFHLLIEADRPTAEVHAIAEEMESRLRREFPQLGRVVIHTEPARVP
ncbi:MAG TPA: cation-efflux pump [Acidobacteriota bacterium]|nr:cation-efflux pump [Acidobacteriota bacterium]